MPTLDELRRLAAAALAAYEVELQLRAIGEGLPLVPEVVDIRRRLEAGRAEGEREVRDALRPWLARHQQLNEMRERRTLENGTPDQDD